MPKAEIVMVLAELAGPLDPLVGDDLPADYQTASVKVTATEKARLKAMEREAGLSEWQIIRQALLACGLI